MPMDDAIGGRVGRGTLGRCMMHLSRLALWSNVAGFANPYDKRFEISSSLVVASVTAADMIVLSVSAVAAAMICMGAGVEFAAGKWLLTSFATVIVALETQRRLSVYSLAEISNVYIRLSRMMLANFVAGAAGTGCLALISVPPQAWHLWLPVWFCGIDHGGRTCGYLLRAKSLAPMCQRTVGS